jgi:BlaI family penicillinase repressor
VREVVFTDRELDLMAVLWERGPSTVADVRAGLADDLAYTTVLTILRTLEEKGYVGHVAEGRAYRYHALVERGEARISAVDHNTQKLTDEQLQRIRSILDARLGGEDE